MGATSKGNEEGIRVYRASEAPDLHESGATKNDFGPNTELMETAAKLASSDCSINKLMLHQSRDEGGLSIVYLFFKPNFPLFRHAHDVDSLYVVISGSVVDFMGKETLRPGDIWSVNAGTSYWYTAGPTESKFSRCSATPTLPRLSTRRTLPSGSKRQKQPYGSMKRRGRRSHRARSSAPIPSRSGPDKGGERGGQDGRTASRSSTIQPYQPGQRRWAGDETPGVGPGRRGRPTGVLCRWRLR